jgi:DNA-binding MarR family transcriptional regulator
VLYELAHRDSTTAAELCKDLGLDAGYVSRMLRRFTREGLLKRRPAEEDKRQTQLWLTAKGHRTFAPLNEGARQQVGALLEPLSDAERRALISAMEQIETLLR